MLGTAELLRRSRVVVVAVNRVLNDHRLLSLHDLVMVRVTHPDEILVVVQRSRLLASLRGVALLVAAVAHGIVSTRGLVILLEDFEAARVEDGEIVVVEGFSAAIQPRLDRRVVPSGSLAFCIPHFRM